MMQLLAALDRGLMRIAGWIIVATTLVLVTLVLFLVIDRSAIGTSFMGTHELALMAAMWLYMAGSVVAMRNREHITVDYLAGRIQTPLLRALHSLAVSVLLLAFTLFFAALARDLVGWAVARPQRTPALGLSQLWAQGAIAVAAGFAIIYAVRDFAVALLAMRAAIAERRGAEAP